METARVDIRKLQLLNDRISQCLDALAQVRLSVHGLSHSGSAAAGIGPNAGAPGQMPGQPLFGGVQGGQDPRFAQSAQIPYTQGFTPFTPPFASYYGGLSHSPFGQPFGAQQQGAYWPQQQSPFGPQQQGPFAQQGPPFAQTNGPQQQGWGTQIPGWGGMAGLSHTGIDIESLYGRPLWADPLLAARVRETFPYAGYSLSPFVSLF